MWVWIVVAAAAVAALACAIAALVLAKQPEQLSSSHAAEPGRSASMLGEDMLDEDLFAQVHGTFQAMPGASHQPEETPSCIHKRGKTCTQWKYIGLA